MLPRRLQLKCLRMGNNLRALITGANGQLGTAVAATSPDDVTCICAGHAEIDLCDRMLSHKVSELAPDLIINTAAYNAVDCAEDEPSAAYAVNAEGVRRLAETGIKLVHISTNYVFDGTCGLPAKPGDEIRPINTYGESKRAGEIVAGHHDALVVRTSWVYAANHSNFVTRIASKLADGETLRVVTDEVASPTHASSLARAIWSLVDCEKTGLFHYCDAGVASRYDFAVAVAEEAVACGLIATAASIEPIHSAERPNSAPRPAYSVLDCRDCWAITGTPHHWREELRMMLRLQAAT